MGPMYAGKTSLLVQDYLANASVNKIIIDYDILIRDENQNSQVGIANMQTHNGVIAPNVYRTKNLYNLYNHSNYMIFSKDVLEYYINMFESSEYIYINEAQFFGDLKTFVLSMVSYGKSIYLYGLDADYKQEKIGIIWDLIPYASTVKKLTGKCAKCNNRSIISHRTSGDKQVYLPDANSYQPLCLKCYSVEKDIFNVSSINA